MTYLSEQRAEVPGKVDSQGRLFAVVPDDEGPVEALGHLLGDAEVPHLEDLVLEGCQEAHRLLVLSEDLLGPFAVADGVVQLLEGLD